MEGNKYTYTRAKRRVEVTQRNIQNGGKRKKDHLGDLSDFNFDKENCIHEVNSYNENDEINFSALARKYNLRNSNQILPKNASETVKESLLSKDLIVQDLQIAILILSFA